MKLPPDGWERHGKTLVREFQFRDFDDGMRLMERIAAGAVDYGRRPDMSISLNRVRIEISNLHHYDLTPAELRLAAKVDAVLAEHPPPAARLVAVPYSGRSSTNTSVDTSGRTL